MCFVADAAELGLDDVVLEPGPGTGGLTALLAERAAAVVAVELDRKLFELASERLAGLTNVRLIHSDIMGKGDQIAPAARAALEEALARHPRGRLKVVANLPYGVSTAFIAAMLAAHPDRVPLKSAIRNPRCAVRTGQSAIPNELVVMVQREVAERLCAAPGSEEYGYLSVIVQALARVESLRRLSPKAFWPQPEVDSAVVRIRPDPALRGAAGDVERLRAVAGGLFTYRRKQLAAALRQSRLTPGLEEARTLLDGLGIRPEARCEELPVSDFIRISKALS